MINIIIVDDEFAAREELVNILSNFPDTNVKKTFDNGIDSLIYLQSNNDIDLIFLDINMPNLNGLELSKKIHELNSDVSIIFSTGYSEYAVQAFELYAFDYILKPYTVERIAISLNRLRKSKLLFKNKKIPTEIPLWVNSRIVMFSPKDEIYYVYSDEKKKVKIITTKGVLETSQTLKDLEEKLLPYNFLRTHKSYIANLNLINEIIPWFNNTYMLKLKGQQNIDIPVSRHYLPEFKENLGL